MKDLLESFIHSPKRTLILCWCAITALAGWRFLDSFRDLRHGSELIVIGLLLFAMAAGTVWALLKPQFALRRPILFVSGGIAIVLAILSSAVLLSPHGGPSNEGLFIFTLLGHAWVGAATVTLAYDEEKIEESKKTVDRE
jgi:hypothetical protein